MHNNGYFKRAFSICKLEIETKTFSREKMKLKKKKKKGELSYLPSVI